MSRVECWKFSNCSVCRNAGNFQRSKRPITESQNCTRNSQQSFVDDLEHLTQQSHLPHSYSFGLWRLKREGGLFNSLAYLTIGSYSCAEYYAWLDFNILNSWDSSDQPFWPAFLVCFQQRIPSRLCLTQVDRWCHSVSDVVEYVTTEKSY
jgi:hypothetical protein